LSLFAGSNDLIAALHDSYYEKLMWKIERSMRKLLDFSNDEGTDVAISVLDSLF